MKIIELEIIGYGRWENKKITNLQDFQLFFGPNEAGKSTIMAFIHSILFGFPTKQQSLPRMEPKSKGSYGGKLLLEDDTLGRITVERLRGKATGDVTLYYEDGSIGTETDLEKLLGGMDRSRFQSIFSFDIHGLQNVQNLKEVDFERYLLATGTIGSDVLIRAEERLQKRLDELFKPSGKNPKLNQQLVKVKQAFATYQDGKRNNQQYLLIVEELEAARLSMTQYQSERQRLRTEMEIDESLLKVWPVYAEWHFLCTQMEQLGDLTFPANGIVRLEHLEGRMKELNAQLIQWQERLVQLVEKQRASDFWSETDAEKVDGILETWPLFQEWKRRQKELQQELVYLEQKEASQFAMIEAVKVIPEDEDILAMQLDVSVERGLEVLEQEADQNQKALEEQERQLEWGKHELNQLQKQCEDLEGDLWSSAKFQQVQQQMEKRETRKKKDFPVTVLGLVLLFLVSLILAGVLQWLVLYFVAFVFGAGSFVLWLRFSRKNIVNTTYSPTEYAEFMGQKQARVALKECYDEMDRASLQAEQREQKAMQIRQAGSELDAKWQGYRELFFLPSDFSGKRLGSVLYVWREIQQGIKSKRKARNDAEILTVKVSEWENRLEMLAEQLSLDELPTEEQVMALKAKRQARKEFVSEIAKSQEKEEQLRNQIAILEREKASIALDKSELLEAANVKSEELFRQKGLQVEQQWKWQERVVLLRAQLTDAHLEGLANVQQESDISEQILARKDALRMIDTELDKYNKVLAERELARETLEDGQSFSDRMQHFYSEQEAFQELAQEWVRVKLAKDMVSSIMRKLQEEKLPKVLIRATHFFDVLSKGNYAQVRFVESRLQVERRDGLRFFPEELSQATKEQLYLAIRFAVIQMLHAEQRLPIIIDDSFVNFDEERLEEIMVLLQEIRRENQVIFFTCHKQLSKYFSKEAQHMLY
ncbi:ATP-binding protein [Listeria grandensis]|uniref:ATP-binding protein n=1 Tax=Listeria grandensis TaxID=1494963 RepID=UPI00164D02C8|nr:AAA family ATPase [Listeria grandensis]MBC6316821.1 AAA family ATPase [Listeria grandensis]